MERIILLIDMDAFFAQIEEKSNPQFKGKPVVVGADPKEGLGRGVVSTANYEARKYGIHSALPISKAYRLCPNAIFLPVDMELYQKISEEIMKIVKKYSPLYEIVSLDEAYLDISFAATYEKAKRLAEKLKREIIRKEKLTATVGIGPNKVIAKMAAEAAKPNGLLAISPGRVSEFLDPLDIEKLPGIGPKTAAKMRTAGVNKIYDLKRLSLADLETMFKKAGDYFYERARGKDDNPVSSEEIIKSIGKEYTFEHDTRDSRVIFDVFEELLQEVYKESLSENLTFKTITVVCRFSGFETHTKSKTMKAPVKEFSVFHKEAKHELLQFLLSSQKPVRLVGVRVSHLCN